MLEKYKSITKEIIDLAKQYGAEHASVSLANSTSFQVDVREEKIESLQESGSSGVSSNSFKKQTQIYCFFK